MATNDDVLVQEVNELTAMLRTEDGFRVLREALSAAELDPGSVLLGGFIENAEGYESGLIVASSGSVMEYEFDWRQPRPLVRWGPADDVPELLKSYAAAEVAIGMASDLPGVQAVPTMSPDPLEVAVRVLNSGGSRDDAAVALVDLGVAPIPAIKALRAAAGIDLGEAKAIVHPRLPEATQRSAEQLWDAAEAALQEHAEGEGTIPDDDRFRFAVTAVLTITGRGTVAAGIVQAGVVRVGDLVEVIHGDQRRIVTCHGVEMITVRPASDPPTIGLLLPELEKSEVCSGDSIRAS